MTHMNNIDSKANKRNGNCKGVRCLTDGSYYPAMKDAAKANGVRSSSMSYAIKHKTLCKGKRYAWESETETNVMEMGRNLSEMETLRAKANAYDMLMLEQKEKEEAEAKRLEAERKAEELRMETERKAKAKRERKIAELKAKVNHQQGVVDKANARVATETNKLMALERELEALMDEEV